MPMRPVVQVLREKGRNAKTQSRMWIYCAPKNAERANILFEYATIRSGENAVNFLGNYDVYPVCDGYDGYNRLKSASRCGCFAHVRRKGEEYFTKLFYFDDPILPW